MHSTAATATARCHSCPHCGEDWMLSDFGYYMLDAHVQELDFFASFMPCCEGARWDVECNGYEATVGCSIEQIVQEFTGYEVLEVEQDDATIVCRLQVRNPTALKADTDAHGHAKMGSPKGWQKDVFASVDSFHRHHPAPQGWKFGVAVYNGPVRVGVATVGRPVSRVVQQQQPHTLEVTRVCTFGAAPLRKNAVSKLYSTCGEQAKAAGYRKIITYTIHEVEDGRSLQASGWQATNVSGGGSWRCAARPDASEAAPTNEKVRWERGLCKSEKRAVRRNAIQLPAQPAAAATAAERTEAAMEHAVQQVRAGLQVRLLDLLTLGMDPSWAQPAAWDAGQPAQVAAAAAGLQVQGWQRRVGPVLA